METAKEIIHKIELLPANEKQQVIDFCRSFKKPKQLNPEFEKHLNQLAEEVQQGVNVSPTFTSMDDGNKIS